MARAFGLEALGRMDTVEYLRCAAHLDRWPGDYRAHQLIAQNTVVQTDGKTDPRELIPWQGLDDDDDESPFAVLG